MDGSQFDTLLRGLTTARSRRGAVLGLLGGTLGLLGFSDTEAKKHKKKKKKHGGGSPPPSPPVSPPTSGCQPHCQGKQCGDDGCGSVCGGCGTGQVCTSGTCCIPEPVGNTCAGRCGTWTNNCGQSVPCAACPAGKVCLSNGSCSTPCPNFGVCPAGCSCTPPNGEGAQICAQNEASCADLPQPCTTTTDCPVGQHCITTGCGQNNTDVLRCGRVC
jgi:hypothetical protein